MIRVKKTAIDRVSLSLSLLIEYKSNLIIKCLIENCLAIRSFDKWLDQFLKRFRIFQKDMYNR